MNLLKNVNISQLAIMSSGSTSVSDAIDMSGYEGCIFLVHGSTLMEGSGAVGVHVAGSTASGGTFVPLRGGSSQYKVSSTALATGSKDKRVFALDLYKPLGDNRYYKAIVTGASSGAIYQNSITAIQYGYRRVGSGVNNQSTTLAGSTTIVSPTSG